MDWERDHNPIKENIMSGVLTHTPRVYWYALFALAIVIALILTFAPVPSVDVSTPPLIPVTGEQITYVDYAQRHPELSAALPGVINTTTDYFFRHPELRVTRETVDLTDYYFRNSLP